MEDEIDLKTLSDIPVSANNAVTTRKYIFVKGMPSRLKQAQLKPYGITDVVYFDDYKEMFDVLYDIWNESQKISNSELDLYQNIPIISLRQNDEKNARYFYHCKNLNDLKKNTVTIPYFFIERKTREKILANIETHKIHIIYGTRVSGKSYLLIDLYKSIKDRKTMFFDGRLRINDNAFKQILATKNAVVIFDTGALSARQIDALLLSANNIHRNSTDIVLALNNSDNDVTGLIKLRIKEFSLDKNMIIDYDISNRLNSEENRQINDRLPYASLPPFKEHLSIIDNLIEAGNIMNISGKFEHIPIDSDISYKDLALLITLATKKKVYSLDIIKFGLEQEIGKAVSKYNPYIDIMPSNIIEKDSADMSSIKYIVNAHYWLCRALGEFATNKNNYDKIINAYKYIIERLKANAGSAQYKQYRACREFILFDTINKIFLNEKGGQMPLIVCLYREMHSFFANDAQFLHQNAKCYFRYSFYPKNQEKERYLNEALTMSKISAEMFENQYNERKNEKVLISQAHVHYTIASILSTICKQHKYQYIDEIRDAIEAIHIALCSPYNIDDFRNKHRSLSSTSIDSIIQDIYTADIQLDSDLNKKLSNIIQQMIARTDTVF